MISTKMMQYSKKSNYEKFNVIIIFLIIFNYDSIIEFDKNEFFSISKKNHFR